VKNYQLPLWFGASYAVKPAKIRTNLLGSETTVHWPHFCRQLQVHSVTHCQLWKHKRSAKSTL